MLGYLQVEIIWVWYKDFSAQGMAVVKMLNTETKGSGKAHVSIKISMVCSEMLDLYLVWSCPNRFRWILLGFVMKVVDRGYCNG